MALRCRRSAGLLRRLRLYGVRLAAPVPTPLLLCTLCHRGDHWALSPVLTERALEPRLYPVGTLEFNTIILYSSC